MVLALGRQLKARKSNVQGKEAAVPRNILNRMAAVARSNSAAVMS